MGWLMLLAGIGLLLFGAFRANATAASGDALNSLDQKASLSCMTSEELRDCDYEGNSPSAALQAKIGADAGWTQVGLGLTIGGALLAGAGLISPPGRWRGQ